MDIDYDATVYFLWKKHDGDWTKISNSFAAFLKFAQTLGGMQEKQLSHVDTSMLCDPRILQHRVEYIRWKLSQKQEARRERKKSKLLHAGLEEDSVFGGKSVPSGHNVLQNSLGDRLAEIADEVRNNLPTIEEASDSDSDSENGSLPEVFFSGYDWSKMKLPGDEGFSWGECDDTNMDTDISHEKLTGQDSLTNKKDSTTRFKTPQELAQQFFSSETLPGPSKVSEAICNLDSYKNRGGLEEQLAAGDMSFLKRMINPDRPKRPSEMKYEEDEDVEMDDEILKKESTSKIEITEMKSSIKTSATAAAVSTTAVRSNRWTVIEHSDSSDESDDENYTAAGKASCKGYKGGKGGKGIKGTKALVDP